MTRLTRTDLIMMSWWVDPKAGRSLWTMPMITVVAPDRETAREIAGDLDTLSYDPYDYLDLALDSLRAQSRIALAKFEKAGL